MSLRKLWAAICALSFMGGFPSAIAQTLAPTPIVDSTRLYVLDCGYLPKDNPGHGASREQLEDTTFADMCYLIVNPKGTLLWESGLSDAYAGRPPYEQTLRLVPGTRHQQIVLRGGVLGQLRDLGYTPDKINYYSLSHGHWDHLENSNAFAKTATFLISKAEYDVMFPAKLPDNPAYAQFFKTNYEFYKDLKQAKTVFVEDNHDVFGDGSAVIVSAPGHSPGHSVLKVTLKNAGVIILAGDLFHHPEEITLNINEEPNKEVAAQSRSKILKLAHDLKARLWMAHDIKTFRSLKHSPDFYD